MKRKSIHLARQLRRTWTDAEQRIWHRLKGRQVTEYKFRRQHPIGPYIVDFVCIEKRLIIELDGSQHLEDLVADPTRACYLTERGFRMLRFWNDQVLLDPEGVLTAIHAALEEQPPSPQPSPLWGEGDHGQI